MTLMLAPAGCGGDGVSAATDSTAADTTVATAEAPTSDPPITTSGPGTTGEPTTGETVEPGTGTGTTTADTSTTATDTSTGTGTDDTGPPPVTGVPVFLAQGHYGRTTISCDDGKTWIQDRSQDDGVRCFEENVDCDHNAYAGRGVAWGDGVFALTWGWGQPGTLQRSSDASAFDIVMTDTPTYAGLAYGGGRFVANNSPTRISSDRGLTWQDGGELNIDINTRSIDYLPHGDGIFIVTGESGDERAIVRSPDGVTWTPASKRPPECGSYARGMAYGGGTIVLASGNGGACSSQDGGDTWQHTPVTDAFSSPPVWTGQEFYIYNGATLWRSADGAAWASESLTPDTVDIGALARSPDGTMVAASGGWMSWYDQQHFYRSSDGKTWKTLPPGSFVGSHPINFISYGTVDPGAGCPAP